MQKQLQVSAWAITIMRISFTQMLIAALFITASFAEEGSAQNVLERKITIDLRNTSLRAALTKIEKVSDAKFLYHSQLVSSREKISLEESDKPLSEVLDKLLEPFEISYEVTGNQIVLTKINTDPNYETGNEEASLEMLPILQTVEGIISDENGSPLPGVNVIEKGTTNGTTSDVTGTFRIDVQGESSILVFSFIGYKQQEQTVGLRTNISIALNPDIISLNEIVVIGYGEREKKDVTGAISTMNADDISKSTAMTPQLAMQGRMAGVFVSTPSGNPFARPNVQIRGVATWGFSEPLYVIDGVPILEGAASSPSAGFQDIRSPINIMASINPNDIESISVLKDASAAAIYGVRASNGVILITTKKGKKGEPKVEFNMQAGVQNVAQTFDVLNTTEYTKLYQEAYANNPTEAPNLPAVFNPGDPTYLGNSPTYDWQDELLNKNAMVEDYSIRVSGGSESTSYYVSGGYGKTEGSLKENSLDRYSMASNVTSKINKYIETGMNLKLSYNSAVNNTGTDLGYVSRTPAWQPILDPNDPNGYAPSVVLEFDPNPGFDLALLNPGAAYNIRTGYPQYLYGPATYANVFGRQATTESTFDLFRTIGNVYLQVEPIKGLKFKGTVSGDYYFNLRKNWNEYSNYRFSQTPTNPYSGHDGTAKGSYGERQSRNFNLVKEFSIMFNHGFGDHNIDILLNAMDQESTWRFTDASSGQINYIDPEFRNVGNNPPFNGTFTGRVPQALQGYLARASYKFKDKYYLDATIRRDGASTFAPGYRWGTFPSFAAGWRISSERFFQAIGTNIINDLKFRGGWGELGNKETSQGFAYLSSVNTTPDVPLGSGLGNPFGTQYAGARFPNYPNFDLSWERVRTSNLGFDATLLNDFTLTAEYYSRYTEGIIQLVSLPPSSGIEAATDLNIGNVRNNGVEVQLGYAKQFGELGFNASANFTTVKNRLVTMYQGTPFGSEGGRFQEGYSLGYLWGHQAGGIFQNSQEITDWKNIYTDNIGTNNQQPGDMWFRDVNGNPEPGEIVNPVPDNIVNNNDRTYLGKTIAGFYYGFNFGLNYKGFDMSVFFQGVGDIQKYNAQRASGENMSSTGANQWATTLGRWTDSNLSTTMPRAVRSDPNQNNRFSDRFVEDASFLRLKNVQVGYTIPSTLLNKTNAIDHVRIFFSGTNLMTFTSWTGTDPENDVNPPLRQLMLGINATF